MSAVGLGFILSLTLRALDGDTLVAQSHETSDQFLVRLAGIDAPEGNAQAALRSRAHLDQLVRGEVVWCSAAEIGVRRLLMTCIRQSDGLDVGAAQVDAGHAVPCVTGDRRCRGEP